MEGVLAELASLRGRDLVFELSYEDLVAQPEPAIRALCDFLELPWESSLLVDGEPLPLVNTVTPPDPNKWRRYPGSRMGRILPLIAEAQRALGYPSG